MKQLDYTNFEIDVLWWLLGGNDPVITSLRQQFCNSKIKSRKFTGVGFYLYFRVPSIFKINHKLTSIKSDFNYGDVVATVDSINNDVGFILWIKNGYLFMLEGYTFGEQWPKDIKRYTIRYINGVRNLYDLQKKWLLSNITVK
jgi:hypothetical protein